MKELFSYPLSISISDVIQVILLYLVLYYIAKNIYRTRAWILVKGLLVLAIIYFFFVSINFEIMKFLIENLINVLAIAIVIMFQPQLQQFIEKVGSVPLTKLFKRNKELLAKYSSDNTIRQITQACEAMSKVKTGALIVIEKDIPLTEYANTGIKIDSLVSKEMLINTFEKNTPLHDGAVIIKGDRVVSATCYLPLSRSKDIPKDFGTRHRAAMGVSEDTDAVVVVVSEETGKISLCQNGKIKDFDKEEFINSLTKDEKIINRSNNHTTASFKGLVILAAIAIWLNVMIMYDPVTIKRFDNIPVTIQNEQVLSDMNKYYSIQKGSTITVEVSARRSELNKISRNSIKALADMKDLSITNAVPIKTSIGNNNAKYEVIGNDIMTVVIEEGKQLEQKIEVEQKGKMPKDAYLNKIELGTENVLISGPGSIIDTIDKAIVEVDLSQTSETLPIKVFDRNGADITSKIKLNISEVEVSIDYFTTKNITLNIHVKDKVYTKEVLVAGKEIKIDSLDINIDISDEEAKSYVLDVQKHLPTGLYYVSKERVEIALEG